MIAGWKEAAWKAMPMVWCRDLALYSGANAQRRRPGDTHEQKILRTTVSAVRPRSADPSLTPSKRNAHGQTRLFRDAAKERRPVPPVPRGVKKICGRTRRFRPQVDPGVELFCLE